MWLEMRCQILEDRLLDGFAFCRGLDHEVGCTEFAECHGCRDSRQRRVPLIFRNPASCQLSVHVPPNQFARGVKRFPADVIEFHLVASQRQYMGNAIAHLAGTDDSNGLYGHP